MKRRWKRIVRQIIIKKILNVFMKIFNNSDIVLEKDNIKITFHSYVLIPYC